MRYLTAGESHGAALCAIIEGIPAGLKLDEGEINRQLKRRQSGYGRGKRMQIESDKAVFLSGLRGGYTLGSPIAFIIPNSDAENWKDVMSPFGQVSDRRSLTKVRPGHADLTGCIKYGFSDARNVLERSSARETAARVGVGAVCRALLEKVGITIGSHVLQIGDVSAKEAYNGYSAKDLIRADESDVRCMDENAAKLMRERIDAAMGAGDTLGGRAEIVVSGVPVGLGSYVQCDRRLDAALAGAIMGVQSVKGVHIGGDLGPALGSEFGDRIYPLGKNKYMRKTNNAGGIEGGISNGENIVIRAAIKPIPTLMRGLDTVDISTGKAAVAAAERSDVCAVPAAAVVIENVVACVLAEKLLEVTGADTMAKVEAAAAQMREGGNIADRSRRTDS